MDINCIKRHFGAGGALVEVGTASSGKPDGVYWVAAAETQSNATKGKKIEVATPKKTEDKE